MISMHLKKKGKAIKSGEPRFLADAYFDWVTVFVASLCLALVLIVLGTLTYFSMSDRILTASKAGNSKVTHAVDTALLEKTLGQYDARAAAAAKATKGYDGVGDPSL